MKLDRKALEYALGPDYVLQGEDWEVWLWVLFQGLRVGHLNISDGTLDSWIQIKWQQKPDGWKPYEEELGGEELIDVTLRPLWEARGFVVEREGISSCWHPDRDPMTAFPAVEVSASIRVKDIETAVAAIRFITNAERVVWADAP